MMVADTTAPNRLQDISNHHVVLVVTEVPHKLYYAITTLKHNFTPPLMHPCFVWAVKPIAHLKSFQFFHFHGDFPQNGILHILKLHLHTLSPHFWLNLCPKTKSLRERLWSNLFPESRQNPSTSDGPFPKNISFILDYLTGMFLDGTRCWPVHKIQGGQYLVIPVSGMGYGIGNPLHKQH